MNSTATTTVQSPRFEGLHSFEPSAERVRFLDQRMRSRLADSLRHIWEQGNGLLQVPSEKFQKFVDDLESQPVSPLAFSLYSDAVLAIEEMIFKRHRGFCGERFGFPQHPGE